jgi:hypothetical protein
MKHHTVEKDCPRGHAKHAESRAKQRRSRRNHGRGLLSYHSIRKLVRSEIHAITVCTIVSTSPSSDSILIFRHTSSLRTISCTSSLSAQHACAAAPDWFQFNTTLQSITFQAGASRHHVSVKNALMRLLDLSQTALELMGLHRERI